MATPQQSEGRKLRIARYVRENEINLVLAYLAAPVLPMVQLSSRRLPLGLRRFRDVSAGEPLAPGESVQRDHRPWLVADHPLGQADGTIPDPRTTGVSAVDGQPTAADDNRAQREVPARGRDRRRSPGPAW
ncbi:hypothetical protein DL769_008796 [Monosporascus sp. CRB-8-3]|nr:hypothetical protein DL769_008796 [Monosporascus sp. CRB-8-3]